MIAYGAAVHDSTKCSPNLLMLRRETDFPIDIIAGNPIMMLRHVLLNMWNLYKKVWLLIFNMLENVTNQVLKKKIT